MGFKHKHMGIIDKAAQAQSNARQGPATAVLWAPVVYLGTLGLAMSPRQYPLPYRLPLTLLALQHPYVKVREMVLCTWTFDDTS